MRDTMRDGLLSMKFGMPEARRSLKTTWAPLHWMLHHRSKSSVPFAEMIEWKPDAAIMITLY